MHMYPSSGEGQARPEISAELGTVKHWNQARSHPSCDTAPGDSPDLSGPGIEIPVLATHVDGFW